MARTKTSRRRRPPVSESECEELAVELLHLRNRVRELQHRFWEFSINAPESSALFKAIAGIDRCRDHLVARFKRDNPGTPSPVFTDRVYRLAGLVSQAMTGAVRTALRFKREVEGSEPEGAGGDILHAGRGTK